MATPTPSPTRTLSAVLDQDRRRDRSPFRCGGGGGGRPVVARSYSSLMVKIHRWGISCLPKNGAEAARRHKSSSPPKSPPPPKPSPPPPDPKPSPAVAVSSPKRRPLRESEAAAVDGGSERKGKGEEAMAPVGLVGGGGGGMRVLAKPVGGLASPPVETGEKEYLWADKYQPKFLKEFICNKDVAQQLYQLATMQECCHFIFQGPQGVGKRSMVLAFLRDAFGPDKLKIKERTKRIELKGEIANHIDVRVKMSDHHVEVNLPELHGYEKHVITTLLNESLPPKNLNCDRSNCRAIVLHGADKLSPDVQHYISWFLEKYVGCNKIFFCCSDASNLEAVKHLCKVVTIQPPSFDEIVGVLEYIAKQENIDLPTHLARRIAESSSHNLRQAVRSFEATWKSNYPFTENQDILTGWEEEISNIAKNIIEEQSPRQLYIIRGKIRKLIEYNVPPTFIFCHLIAELKKDKDQEFQKSIDDLALTYNNHRQDGRAQDKILELQDIRIEGFAKEAHDPEGDVQYFMKIEEFAVRFMSYYKSLTAKNSGTGNGP